MDFACYIREYRQKTLIMLSIFWPLKGWVGGGCVNPLEKENL